MSAPPKCSKFVCAGIAALAALASFGTADAGVTVLYAFSGGNDGSYPEAGVLYAFRGHSHGDGSWPAAGVIRDGSGNLYGTTASGGIYKYGIVFKLAPDGTETVLHSFAGGSDGAAPLAGLIRDKAGNLYGTTYQGGANDCYGGQGCGTVFKIGSDGAETILYAFRTRKRAYSANPAAGLIRDEAGNFYGTTEQGGYGCNGYGCGTVFRLAK